MALPSPTATARPGLLKNLLDRRIPQIAGVYLGFVWSLFQFVRWLINRFVLSPYLEDLFLLTALLATPSILVLAYYHGARGKNRWTRTEKVFIPCNVLAAIGLLFFLFNGKDLGSAQETVTLVDARGNEQERVIPKSEFRKRLAVFDFANATGDPDLDWTRYGITGMLLGDLLQDLFITATPAFSFSERMRKAGFTDGYKVPLALQRQIAEERQLDYVLNGTLKQNGPSYVLDTRLYRTQSGKLLAERSFEGDALLPLIDEATVQLKHDLEIPRQHIEDTPDLPASEVLTASLPALRALSEATYALAIENDFATAATLMEQAVTEDPTFAFAHLLRGQLFKAQQRFEDAVAAYRTVQQHSYRLPERYRFALNTEIFFLEQKPDEALQAALQWHTLYPDDVRALQFLADLRAMRNETDEAVALLRKLADLDPSEPAHLLRIGDLLRDVNRYEDALEAYRAYIDRFPDRTDGYQRTGWVYSRTGDVEKKLAAYKQAMIADPNDPGIIRDVAFTLFQLGDFEEAYRHYQMAIAQSRTPAEKANSYESLAYYYWIRGQYDRFIESLETAWAHMAEYLPDNTVLQRKASQAANIARGERTDLARRVIEEARAHPAASSEGFYAINLDLYESEYLSVTDRPEEALALLDRARPKIVAFGILNQVSIVDFFRGLALKRLGRWEDAATAFETYLEMVPAGSNGWIELGETNHRWGRLDEAARHFRQALRLYPSYPDAHLGLARVLQERGRADEARDHLDKALAAWAEADAVFAPAREARALRDALP